MMASPTHKQPMLLCETAFGEAPAVSRIELAARWLRGRRWDRLCAMAPNSAGSSPRPLAFAAVVLRIGISRGCKASRSNPRATLEGQEVSPSRGLRALVDWRRVVAVPSGRQENK